MGKTSTQHSAGFLNLKLQTFNVFFLENSNVLSVCLDIYLTWFIKSESVCILCELWH